MACYHIEYNASRSFIPWRGIKTATGNDAYTDPEGKEVAVPSSALVINDHRNLDLNVPGNVSDPYACTLSRTAEWIEHYKDPGGVVTEDSNGDGVVFASDWSEIELPTEFDGVAATIYTHETVEIFGDGNRKIGFKENSYPFRGGLADSYFKYYENVSDFIGNIVDLVDKIDAGFTDGEDGGIIYSYDEVDYYVPFNSISSVRNSSYGFDVYFTDSDVVLHFVEIAKLSKPAPLYKIGGEYINESMFWREPSKSGLPGGGDWSTYTHFVADYEADEWEYIKETWDAIAKGKDAYNDLFSLPEYKAKRARKAARRASRRAPKGLQ